jgi:surfeit locus 1 family protein
MTRLRAATGLFVALVVAATCVRLGFWQLERRAGKHRANAELRAALAAPPRALGDSLPASPPNGVVAIRGRYDPARHLLLGGRTHEGEPGVLVYTPLLLRGGGAVLVRRGWLPARDPAEAHPERSAEPGERVVRGLAEPFPPPRRGAAVRPLPGDSGGVLVALHLDREALAPRLPYLLAPFTVRELPGPGVPDLPVRSAPPPLDESTHLGYAVQWFALAAVVLAGSGFLAARGRGRGRT